MNNFFIDRAADRRPVMAQSSGKTVFLDVIMENTGADPIGDSKRIMSVQIGDSSKQDVFYAESNTGDQSLFGALMQVNSLVAKNYTFVGHNLKGMELYFLRRFLNVSIPEYMVLDLRDQEGVMKLQQRPEKPLFKLEEVLSEYKIPLDYRLPIDANAELIRKKPEIVAQADEAAKLISTSKGWSPEFSRQYALNNIATGTAIKEAYDEFVQKAGAKDTIYYKFATGDIVAEHKLLEALRKPPV